MKKRTRIFLGVLYFAFTFSLGILLAIVLPKTLTEYRVYDYKLKETGQLLANKEYSKAMSCIGGLYDSDEIYKEEISESSGIVIFSAATIFSEQKEGTEGTREYLQEVYAGFLYGVKDTYKTSSTETNDTKLVVTDSSNELHSIDLLNYDSDNDEDGKHDSISSLMYYDFIYFEIVKSDITSIKKLDFFDVDNNVFKSVNLNLSFSEAFFNDAQGFITEYNKIDYSNDDIQIAYDAFKAKSNTYYVGNEEIPEVVTKMNEIYKKATWEVIGYLLLYFFVIYLLGDTLVGTRFIIKIFIRIHNKIHKKGNENVEVNEVYGTDYFTQLSYKLVVPEDCDETFSVSYSNENDEIEIVLSKDENYSKKVKVHAGKYSNGSLVALSYEAVDMPKQLEVRGFQMSVEVTLRKIVKSNQ